jgi:putative addiction module component (TIGR02574 family)
MSVQDILSWPAEERAELVARLLDSLDPATDSDSDAEQAWGDEIRRRLDDVTAGQVTPLPWADARAAILSDADGDAG